MAADNLIFHGQISKTGLSTKKQIITHLRKSGGLTVDKLADRLEISPMGVRQHLALMEKDQLLIRSRQRKAVGRPCYVYKLTEDADKLSPKTYESFAKGILDDIGLVFGKEKINQLFKMRQMRQYGLVKDRFKQKNISDRINAFSKYLSEQGLLATVQKNKDQTLLTIHNCVIYQIAKDHPGLCYHDEKLFSDCLGLKTKLLRCQAKGDHLCEFAIGSGQVV